MASIYQEIIDILCTGDVVKLPKSINLSGLRTCFHRFKKECEAASIEFNRTLKIVDSPDGEHYLVVLETHKPIKFEVVPKEVLSNETPRHKAEE